MQSETLNTWLKYIIYTGIFLLPFLPLYVATGMFFPFIAGKGFAFRIIVEIIFAAWVILALRDKEYRPRWSWILGALTLYLVVLGVANLFGENPVRSFWSNFERMMGYVTQLHLFAYFIVSVSVLKTKELWWKLANTSLFASILVAGYALLQLGGVYEIHNGDRIDATFGNATYLAGYLLFHIFIAAYLFVQRHQLYWWLRWAYGGITILYSFLLIHTTTRGAVLGLVGGIVLTGVLLLWFKWRNRGVRRILAGGLIALIVIAGGAYFMRDTALVQGTPLKRLTDISFEQKTVRARFMVWDIARQGFLEHPVLGWGQGNFMLVFNKYYNPKMYDQEPWFDRAHNVVFDTLISSGLLGLFAYLSVIGAALYYIWSPTSNPFSDMEKSVLTGMGAAYVFQNLFVFDNIMSFILFFVSLAFVHVLASEERRTRILGEHISIQPATVARFAAPVVIFALIGTLLFVNARPAIANRALLRAINPALIQQVAPEERGEAVRENLRFFDLASRYGPLGRIEAREQLVLFARKVYQAPVTEAVKRESFQFADTEIQKQIAESPKNTRYHMFHASLLALYEELGRARDRLNAAAETSPERQEIYSMQTRVLITMGRVNEAVEVARMSYELLPENPKAARTYAIALIHAGQKKKAQEILPDQFPQKSSGTTYHKALINAYAATEDYKTVSRLWGELVDYSKNNGQYRVSYAAALARIGKREEAIEQIREAIKIEPQFKNQGEQLIQQIRRGKVPTE